MLINSKDLFFLFARATCLLLCLTTCLIMGSAPDVHFHIAFTAIQATSPVSLLWNGIWFVTHLRYIRRGLGHINTSFAFLIPAEWVITAMTFVPACMALGAVVLLDHDTHSCDRFLQLAALCSKVELAATSYLLAGLLNFAMAFRECWALAAAYPTIHL